MRQMCRTLNLISNKIKKVFDATKKGGHDHGGNDKKQSGGGNKDNGNGKKHFKNECKIHGSHKWTDCYQSPLTPKIETRIGTAVA